MRKLLLILAICALPRVGFAQAADQIIFPHDVHFENDVTCSDCHAGDSELAPVVMPDMDACADCHDVDDDDECAMCHTNVDEAGEYLRRSYGAIVDHAAHARQNISCAACHGEPAASTPLIPGKPDCRVCHDTADDLSDCRLCHTAGSELRPLDHGPAWTNGHGFLASQDQNACFMCHTESTCQECHSGDNVRPRSHRLNYEYDHALDARGNEMQCATCHLEPTYCSSCHIAERVLPLDHSQSGWLNAGGGQHAIEGVFDLESCVACHDTGADEPSCARCHGGG